MADGVEPNTGRSLPAALLDACVRSGRQEFTAGQLCRLAFESYPQLFALDGEPDLLDSQKVKSMLSHRNGVVRRGYIRRTGPGVYELTEAGRAVGCSGGNTIGDGRGRRRAGPDRRTHELPLALARLGSVAYLLWDRGCKHAVTRADAEAFWGDGGPAGFALLLSGLGDEDPRVRLLTHCHSFLCGKFPGVRREVG